MIARCLIVIRCSALIVRKLTSAFSLQIALAQLGPVDTPGTRSTETPASRD
jgi:hypothetical protein